MELARVKRFGGRRGGQALAWGLILSLVAVSGQSGRAAHAAGYRGGVPQQDAPAVSLMYSSAAPLYDAGLAGLINGYVGDEAGQWDVAVKKLDTGQWATFQSDKRVVSASLYKLFVMYEVFRQWDAGSLSLDGQRHRSPAPKRRKTPRSATSTSRWAANGPSTSCWGG